MEVSVKEEILKVLLYVGSATKEELTDLLSNKVRYYKGKKSGEKRESVDRITRQLKQEGLILAKKNDGTKKETYWLSPKVLTKYGVYTFEEPIIERNRKVLEYLKTLKEKVKKENDIEEISFKELLNYIIINNEIIENKDYNKMEYGDIIYLREIDNKKMIDVMLIFDTNIKEDANRMLKIEENLQRLIDEEKYEVKFKMEFMTKIYEKKVMDYVNSL